MLELDGAAGGGQLVRTATTVAALTGESLRMTNVRGARDSDGLKAQHCGAIEAVAAACDADTSGVTEGSRSFSFDPGELTGGEAGIDLGTAGSVTLVFDALLPLAVGLDEPLAVTVTGGTDVKWAPPFDYLRHVKRPLLTQYGLDASLELDRRGFYPAGGGRATLTLRPSALQSVSVETRGRLRDVRIHSVATTHLRDADVADRQAEAVASRLDSDAPIDETVSYVDASSPGSVVVVAATYESTHVGFSALGERGTPAEAVGVAAAEQFQSFDRSDATVDRHLADQLLPFLALAGGEVVAPERTSHVETCLDLLQTVGYDVSATVERAGVRLAGSI